MKIAAVLSVLFLLAPGVCLLAPDVASAAKIYKWTDAQGNVIYSDTPRPGAVEMDVATDPAGVVPVPPQDLRTPQSPAVQPAGYQTLTVVSPAAQQLVENTGGWISVSLAVEPALRSAEGHAIRLRLDGQTLAMRYPGGEIALSNVTRGEHTIQAEVVDPAGTVLITSTPVTFNVAEPSAQAPAGPGTYDPAYPPQPYPPTYDPVYPPQPYPPQGRPKPNQPVRPR